jgi:hypothetical protein
MVGPRILSVALWGGPVVIGVVLMLGFHLV